MRRGGLGERTESERDRRRRRRMLMGEELTIGDRGEQGVEITKTRQGNLPNDLGPAAHFSSGVWYRLIFKLVKVQNSTRHIVGAHGGGQGSQYYHGTSGTWFQHSSSIAS